MTKHKTINYHHDNLMYFFLKPSDSLMKAFRFAITNEEKIKK